MSVHPAPKPKRSPPKKPQFRNSTLREKSYAEKCADAQRLRQGRKKIPRKNPINRAKRERKNRDYYASAEWRAKKKVVHERDGYRCVERIPATLGGMAYPPIFDMRRDEKGHYSTRCLGQGAFINGKQTARGLVAEEKSYGHRGTPGNIARIVTRCRDCDRRLTPLERANHASGFQKSNLRAEGERE